MLGGCERGCGNDRAHAGVGFGGLSIQIEGEMERILHHAICESFIRTCQICQIRASRQIHQIRLIIFRQLSFLPTSTITTHLHVAAASSALLYDLFFSMVQKVSLTS